MDHQIIVLDFLNHETFHFSGVYDIKNTAVSIPKDRCQEFINNLYKEFHRIDLTFQHALKKMSEIDEYVENNYDKVPRTNKDHSIVYDSRDDYPVMVNSEDAVNFLFEEKMPFLNILGDTEMSLQSIVDKVLKDMNISGPNIPITPIPVRYEDYIEHIDDIEDED